MTRALIKLEHYLSKLKKRGKLPVLAENSRSFKRRNFTRGRTAPKGAPSHSYIYFRSAAALSAGLRLRLNGATKRPCLSIR